MLRIFTVATLALALASCGDQGRSCEPMVKFVSPAQVSPTARDGVVTVPARWTCAGDEQLWAWAEVDGLDMALDIYAVEGDRWDVDVPVDDSAELTGCDNTSITIALVDDMGRIIDQDRVGVAYPVERR